MDRQWVDSSAQRIDASASVGMCSPLARLLPVPAGRIATGASIRAWSSQWMARLTLPSPPTMATRSTGSRFSGVLNTSAQ